MTPGRELPGVGDGDHRRETAEECGEDPRERRQAADADADELRRRRFLAGADDRQSEVGAGEEHPEHHGEHGQHRDQPQTLIGDLHTEDRDAIERREGPRDRTALVVEEPLLDRDREQCDARGRDEEGHARRLEERADDDPFGEEAEQHRRQQTTDHGEAVGDVVGVQQVQDAQRDGAELTLGEVEDTARLVDEDEPHGDHSVGRAGHRADDDRLLLPGDDQHRDQDRGESEADQQPGAFLQQLAHRSARWDELFGRRELLRLQRAIGVEQVGAGAAEVVVDRELHRGVDPVVEPRRRHERVHERRPAELGTGGREHQPERLVQRPQLEADVVGGRPAAELHVRRVEVRVELSR